MMVENTAPLSNATKAGPFFGYFLWVIGDLLICDEGIGAIETQAR